MLQGGVDGGGRREIGFHLLAGETAGGYTYTGAHGHITPLLLSAEGVKKMLSSYAIPTTNIKMRVCATSRIGWRLPFPSLQAHGCHWHRTEELNLKTADCCEDRITHWVCDPNSRHEIHVQVQAISPAGKKIPLSRSPSHSSDPKEEQCSPCFEKSCRGSLKQANTSAPLRFSEHSYTCPDINPTVIFLKPSVPPPSLQWGGQQEQT